jgi:hypothetical protein
VYSLRGKTDGRKIGPYDNVAGKSALRDRFLVIRFSQEYPPAVYASVFDIDRSGADSTCGLAHLAEL